MSDLPEKLKAAVPSAADPDVGALWARGRRATRRRTQLFAVGGLTVALLLTVGIIRLTATDDATPLDTVNTPDGISTDGEATTDESPEFEGDVVIDVPRGSVVHLYPVGLPDDWIVTVFPAWSGNQFDTVTLMPEGADDTPVVVNLSFEPGPEGEIRWTSEPDEATPNRREWAGGGWKGQVDDQRDGTFATRLELITNLHAAGFFDDPSAELPPGWRVEGDSRSSTRGSQIEVAPPDSRSFTMTLMMFEEDSYTRAVVDEQMQEFLDRAAESGRDETAGGLPGGDSGLGGVSLYQDGMFYEIPMREDMSEADRQLFLDSLRPVRVVERTNLELLARNGPGPTTSDHWHAAYGIFACDRFLEPFPQEVDPVGIHTHGDGVIHVHPFEESVTGSGATFAVFLDSVGWDFEPGNIGARDGSVRMDDDSCGETETTIRLIYRPGTDRTANPLVFEGDEMFDAHFPSNSGSWILAQIPTAGSVGLLPQERIDNLELAIG